MAVFAERPFLKRKQTASFKIFFSLTLLLRMFHPLTVAAQYDAEDEAQITQSYKDSFQLSLNRQRHYLDSLFSVKKELKAYKEITPQGEIRIGYLFHNKSKYAVIASQVNDTSMQYIVLQKKPKTWDTILQYTSNCYYSEYVMSPYEIIRITDFDGDSIPDLNIITNYWDIHPGETGNLWLFKKGKFVSVKEFEEIVSPVYDYKSKRIYSYQSDGCGDMNMDFAVYQIRNYTVVQLEVVNCDCCNLDNGTCTISKNEKQQVVAAKKACWYVPAFFRSMVRQKCNWN